MRAGYNPEGMSYSPEQVEQRASQVASLTAALAPQATAALQDAVWQQTASASAAALSEEAAAVLKSLLADLEDEQEVDAASLRLASRLSEALAAGERDEYADQAWLASRGSDLARALVGFWFNLDDNDDSRPLTCAGFLAGDAALATRQALSTICARFHMDADAALPLLAALNSQALQAPAQTADQAQEQSVGQMAFGPVLAGAKLAYSQ